MQPCFAITDIHYTSTLALDGSWDPVLQPRVIQAWTNVALRYTDFEPEIHVSYQDNSKIDSRGDAIKYLGLGDHVVSAASLAHTQQESIR